MTSVTASASIQSNDCSICLLSAAVFLRAPHDQALAEKDRGKDNLSICSAAYLGECEWLAILVRRICFPMGAYGASSLKMTVQRDMTAVLLSMG